MIRGLLFGLAFGAVVSTAMALALSFVLPVVKVRPAGPGPLAAGPDAPEALGSSVVAAVDIERLVSPQAAPSISTAAVPALSPVAQMALPALARPPSVDPGIASGLAPAPLAPRAPAPSDAPPSISLAVSELAPPPVASAAWPPSVSDIGAPGAEGGNAPLPLAGIAPETGVSAPVPDPEPTVGLSTTEPRAPDALGLGLGAAPSVPSQVAAVAPPMSPESLAQEMPAGPVEGEGAAPPSATVPNAAPELALSVDELAPQGSFDGAPMAPALDRAAARIAQLAAPDQPAADQSAVLYPQPPDALRPRLSDVPPSAGLRRDGPVQPKDPRVAADAIALAGSGGAPVLLPPLPLPVAGSDIDAVPPVVARAETPSLGIVPPLVLDQRAETLPPSAPGPSWPRADTSDPVGQGALGPVPSPPRPDQMTTALPPLPGRTSVQTATAGLLVPAPARAPLVPSRDPGGPVPESTSEIAQPRPAQPPVAGTPPRPLPTAAPAAEAPRVLPRITVVGQPEPEAEPSPEEAVLPAIVANASAFEQTSDAPLLGVVLVDGPEAQGIDLSGLPFPLAVAVDPLDPQAGARMAALRAAGIEVLVLAPLASGARPADVEVFFEAAFSAVPEAVAVMDMPGAALQSARALAEQAVSILRDSGHGLVTYDKGLNAAVRLAEREAVPVAKVARIFDAQGAEGFAARRMLDQGAFQAGRDGGAVLVGRLTAGALEALATWQDSSKGRTVAFAPVSAVLTR